MIIGPVYLVRIFRTAFVVINSAARAHTILNRNTASSSHRPDMTMPAISGLCGILPLLQPSERFRRTRKIIQKALGLEMVATYTSDQERRAAILARQLVIHPEHFMSEIRRAVIIGSERIVYGYDDSSETLQFAELAEVAMETFKSAADPTVGWIVNTFPLLRHIPVWFPGASFQAKAATFRNVMQRIVEEPFKETIRRIESTTNPCAPCLVSIALGENSTFSHWNTELESLDVIKHAAVSAYIGGIDTSVSVIYSFFLAMVLYPEAQKKAQAEIDVATGKTRLPTIADRGNLPFIDCIFKEVLRWAPPTATIFPHVQNEDLLSADGLLMPKGSLILVNLWAIFRDEASYPEPEQFKPERFLRPNVLDPKASVFGFGRRLCPGIHLVDNWLWIIFATLLATLDISSHVNPETKEEIKPTVAFTGERISQPLPFKCNISARNPDILEM
ncbi:cytochrome P450 [Amylostereum chailletii]|nr:cytochrome P450 [Amylostereum chailletii]